VPIFFRSLSRGISLLLAAALLLMMSCAQPFELKDLVDGPDGKGLIVSPVSAVLQVNGSLSMAASGGIPPYEYMVVSGDGSFVGNQYYAPPSPGTERIRVRDRTGRTHESVIIVENPGGLALGIAPKSATVYTGQTIEFSALGGDGGISYTLDGNASGGTLTGNVYTAGPAAGTDTVTVTDAGGHSASATVTVVSSPVQPPQPMWNVDYLVSGPSSGGNVTLGDQRNVIFTVKNQGTEDGTATVHWTAFLSADRVFDSGDSEIHSGSFPGLVAGASSVPQVIQGGAWSQTGVFYIFVYLTATDEGEIYRQNNLYDCGPFVVTESAPSQPDYRPQDITMYFSHVSAGAAVDEFFTLTNLGAGGSNNVTWTAYASADRIPEPGEKIGSGVVGPLAAGESRANIPIFGASWPVAPGDYYLIVRTEALDESSPGDFISSTEKFTVSVPPDYIIGNPIFPGEAESGTPVSGSFWVRNNGMGDGKKRISWKVYLSFDPGYSDDDLLFGEGELPPLAAGESAEIASGDFNFTHWPVYGACYMIIRIAAGDDSSQADNTYVSPYTELYVLDQERPDNSGPGNNGSGVNPARPIPGTQALAIEGGSLRPGQTLVIRGWSDNHNYDTYKFVLHPEVDLLYTRATWSTGTDLGDIYIWYDSSSNNTLNSTESSPNREPASKEWYMLSGWAPMPDKNCYVSFLSKSAAAGKPYTLYIWGKR